MLDFPNKSEFNYQIGPVSLDDEDNGDNHFRKRCKVSSLSHQQHVIQNQSSKSIQFSVSHAQYNPLDEPSPLGLKLRKTPSLLDLIQMKLSETYGSSLATAPCGNLQVKKNDVKACATSNVIDKLKASKFSASSLQIGNWKYVSKHEGDLVAKYYYSKHKLVWEVLDGGLKSKIEIQCSDIVDLKANCPDNKPGNLNIVLSRPPMFFKESNPQPRKHTVWQATTDFTHGHASMHRQHFLQCPQGVLNKHYEKLIQCDMRLQCLSQQPKVVLHTPYFVSQACGSEGDISRNQTACQLETTNVFPISSVQSVALPSSALSVDAGASEAKGLCHGHNFSGLNDLVNQIGQHISEQMTYGETSDCKDILGDIYHHLLNDTHTINVFDENSLMSKVNSLGCLLQNHVVDFCDQPDRETSMNGHTGFEQKNMCNSTPASMFEIDTIGHEKDITLSNSYKQQPDMPKWDSFEDLLLHLHRIGSLPNIVLNSEDGDNHT